MRTQTGTDYGPYLANEPSPLHTTTIVDRCTEKLVDDWNKMRTNVRAPARPRCSAAHGKAAGATHAALHAAWLAQASRMHCKDLCSGLLQTCASRG